MRNETEQDIYLPPLTIIAELGAYECIISEQHVTTSSAHESTNTPLQLNFGESPVTPEWKERISTKLNAMSNVFSHHDLDFGCTSHVKHQINLHDNTTFKHRARPIHPNDIEAVRKHLRELLDAGVIRESESPFSSPIVVVKKKKWRHSPMHRLSQAQFTDYKRCIRIAELGRILFCAQWIQMVFCARPQVRLLSN